MLRIRLSRFGTKNRPTYRVTIAERAKDAKGNVLEYLGSYNPRSNPKFIQLKEDRIKYWISKGAQPSATVHNLLISQGVIEGKKVRAWRPKKSTSPDASQGGKKEEKPASPKADQGGKKEEKPASPKADQGGKEDVKPEIKVEKPAEETKEEKPAAEVKAETKPEETKVEEKPVEETRVEE